MDRTVAGAQEKILELFRESSGVYISGEQISRALGVSRTAVWKHIRQLRDRGYDIEAVTSRGYLLPSGETFSQTAFPPSFPLADNFHRRLFTL